jgi:hypothetical protein
LSVCPHVCAHARLSLAPSLTPPFPRSNSCSQAQEHYRKWQAGKTPAAKRGGQPGTEPSLELSEQCWTTDQLPPCPFSPRSCLVYPQLPKPDPEPTRTMSATTLFFSSRLSIAHMACRILQSLYLCQCQPGMMCTTGIHTPYLESMLRLQISHDLAGASLDSTTKQTFPIQLQTLQNRTLSKFPRIPSPPSRGENCKHKILEKEVYAFRRH